MPNMRKILIIDDDPELRGALTEQLSLYEEYEAVAAENGNKGVQAAKAGQIDLVIMDVGLPDIDGREAVRILRKNGFKAPIIMLTGHDTDSDTILGLESGANDYVTKPFRFAVLLARVRTLLRQYETSEDAVFAIGPYTFRPSSKLLLNLDGSKVRLTEKETSNLRYLYRAGQRPVSPRRFCRKCGPTTLESPRIRSRRTSIDYGKRSRRMRPFRPSWLLKQAATS
jgi:DNA-binding response OmpR family regulator